MQDQKLSSFMLEKSKLSMLANLLRSEGYSEIPVRSHHELARYTNDQGSLAILYKSGTVVTKKIDTHHMVSKLYNEMLADHKLTFGCDEAGKGEAIGSIFCALVAITPQQELFLRSKGIRDSKELDKEKILDYDTIIKKNSFYIKVVKITPETIERARTKKKNLNDLLTMAYEKLISSAVGYFSSHRNTNYYGIIDEYDSVETQKIIERFPFVVSYRKAEKFIPVASASIVARASYLREIKKEFKPWKKFQKE